MNEYQSITDKIVEYQKNKTPFNIDEKSDPKKYFNSDKSNTVSIRNDLSKVGLANIFMGTKQSGINKNPLLNKTTRINETTNLNQGKTMIINIKDYIIEEGLTEAIQRNASRISGATMLGAGAAAMHAYNGGDFGMGGDKGDTPPTGTPGSDKWDSMSDHEKNVAKNSISTNVHDATKPKGIFGNIAGGLGIAGDNIRSENKMEDMQNTQQKYQDAVNGEGNLLTTGQKVGAGALGALGLGGYAASKMRRK